MPSDPPRRFPAPWTAAPEGESYIVRDATGYAIAYLYFEDEIGRRQTTRRLTSDEARRIAKQIARLPELLAPVQKAGRDEIQKPDE